MILRVMCVWFDLVCCYESACNNEEGLIDVPVGVLCLPHTATQPLPFGVSVMRVLFALLAKDSSETTKFVNPCVIGSACSMRFA